ncbi:hypothetical protein PQ462_22905 [Flavobacterium sp. KACC 22758]|jgi:hypothetical protein|uniref:hypothetical protein n=1 Tax=Flavobacterium sp. KACC 22758 TaxID=3025667 RepID=UPI002365FEB1|nr:hypothetical protein [Flavobacterium sp. KACC 22758]WDF59548.1 hypothetical protein PQ462_22905 [Flavobacterium sp. KACC 22758]
MKKTALTFGLFSLVVVATSFANPVASNASADKSIDISFDTDGSQQGRNGRKTDEYMSSDQMNLNNGQFKSFNSESQLTKSRIKLD